MVPGRLGSPMICLIRIYQDFMLHHREKSNFKDGRTFRHAVVTQIVSIPTTQICCSAHSWIRYEEGHESCDIHPGTLLYADHLGLMREDGT